MLKLLRRRNFALLWFGGLVSMTGDWALRAGLPVYVYLLSGSTLATGAMVAASLVPRLVLGSVAGVFVDRWDRRRTLIVANLLLAVTVLALMVVDTPDRLWVVFAVAVVQASLAQFVQPAEGALLPRLVPSEDLVAANALNALNNDLARLVGPPLGGLVVGYLGLAGVALFDAATFLVAAGMVTLIAAEAHLRPGALSPDRSAAPAGVWGQWLEGLRLVARSRTLAALFAFLAITGLGEGVMAALFAPFVVTVLDGDDLTYGWLLSAQAVGGVVGSAVIARWGASTGPVRLVGLGAIAGGAIDLMIFNGPALVPGATLPLVLMVVVGLPFSAMAVGRMTLVQAATADEHRGRVLGALLTTAALSSLLGTIAGGVLGVHVGIVAMLNIDGVVYCLAGIMLLIVLRSATIFEPARAA